MPNYGWDFDGTLSRSPAELGRFLVLAQGPQYKHYLITGRPNSERKEVLEQLENNGILASYFEEMLFYPKEYHFGDFTPEILRGIAKWKATMCAQKKINVMFENDPSVVDAIKKSHPETLVSLLV